MELFREDGCLSDNGLHALTAGQLDELGRLDFSLYREFG